MLVLMKRDKATGQWGVGQLGEELFAIPPCCLSTANVRQNGDTLRWNVCVKCGTTYALRYTDELGLVAEGFYWEPRVALSAPASELAEWVHAWTGQKVSVSVD